MDDFSVGDNCFNCKWSLGFPISSSGNEGFIFLFIFSEIRTKDLIHLKNHILEFTLISFFLFMNLLSFNFWIYC